MPEDQEDGSERGETVKLCSLLGTYCVPHSPGSYCVPLQSWDLLCASTALGPTVCPYSPGTYCLPPQPWDLLCASQP